MHEKIQYNSLNKSNKPFFSGRKVKKVTPKVHKFYEKFQKTVWDVKPAWIGFGDQVKDILGFPDFINLHLRVELPETFSSSYAPYYQVWHKAIVLCFP